MLSIIFTTYIHTGYASEANIDQCGSRWGSELGCDPGGGVCEEGSQGNVHTDTFFTISTYIHIHINAYIHTYIHTYSCF